ncbi:tripartite tricarboxylate transporter TctB family protein [Pelomicrobium methylotrophicum]|uniref:Tripartite tricarboxylate transporter TctB family protein n=1 Tax=Pelomicrobium methylotrophicum TaxID=2602750 RepID=A0A5C7EGB1_9PROT|nr:tripartite tricarboxylate transporter TctB family protein [Pelomicrobium methylotrophicum]TXF11281.1 tripartite tricarboxylate transporter TctB family protein [Pelomicrobium methylotrophicum]
MPSFIKHPKDFWTGVLYVIIGLAAVSIARDYPMGTALKMGPAYFPTVLGGLLTLIGLAALVRSLVRAGEKIAPFVWSKVILVLVSTLLFGVLIRGAGLVPATAVLVLASAYASVHFRWFPSIALAAGLTLFCALVFVYALGLPLPLFGPWLGG